MSRVCIHLEQSTDLDYVHYFDGVGLEYALICLACRQNRDAIEVNLREVLPERFTEIEEGGCWEADKDSIVGQPQVLRRSTKLRFEHQEIALAWDGLEGIADLQPIPASDSADCLVLANDGWVFRIDMSRGSALRLMNALDPEQPLDPSLSLHVSHNGEMAAVVETRGRYGVVLDLETKRSTMRLDRGDYRFEHSNFPAVFFDTDGQLRLVHATDWNRLDISDPRTGTLLTGRSPTSYRNGEERPEHYLDYFHGGLTVSPAGDRVVDNGWVWGPAGIVVSWSLRDWIEGNPWESEDGLSKKDLCLRRYFWNGPLCWTDNRNVAIWGYGNDDLNLIPAVLLFDVESGHRVGWFAGPVGSLAHDRYLFSYSDEAGTSVWDVATGERLLHDASFSPTAYHPGARRFVTVRMGESLLLSRLVDG